MNKIKEFFVNSVILTFTALFIRLVSVGFNIYIANQIGFLGVGILELIFAVYAFAVIFAAGGVSLAATRLVSEEIAKKSDDGIRTAMSRCIRYSIVCGILGCLALFFSAEFLGTHVLRDERTITSLKILAFSLPLIAVQSGFFGYFTAVRRVVRSAISQISDQIAKIIFTLVFLSILMPMGIEYACIAIALSIVCTEIMSFTILIFLFKSDINKHYKGKVVKMKMSKKLLRISVPVALSSYASSALSSIKHIIIPICLVQYGMSQQESLSYFGMIGGMVLPIITFPAAFLAAVSNLVVPEISECNQLKNYNKIDLIASKSMEMTLLFSMGILGVFLRFSNEFGMLIYSNIQIGTYIKILAPLIIIIYLDTVVDAMLKGLDKQVNSMFYNIIDSIFSIILVLVLIPRFGLEGMLFVIFAGKIFNMLLSVNKIITETNVKFNFINWIFKPFAASIISSSLIHFLSVKIVGYSASPFTLTINIVISLLFYLLILRLVSPVSKKDISLFKNAILGH